jgi:N4-gp56 family major capsid protein
MATTTLAPSLSADVSAYLAEDLLPLTLSELVIYDFADKVTLPKGRGTTYTMSRYARAALPFAPTAEGVPPVATPLVVSQASVQLQQWTGLITITDVAQDTIFHDVFAVTKERIALMSSELMERNAVQAIFGFTQVNYVNSRGSRAALTANDQLNPQELQRAYSMLVTLGAHKFKGPTGPDVKLHAEEGEPKALSEPRGNPHFVGVVHPFVEADLRNNPQVQLVSAYSSPNRLYNGEFGEWNGIRFISSNMVPSFVGAAAITGTGAITGGTLGTGNYQIVVTQSDTTFNYETIIAQQSASINIASGSTGSISVILPASPGYTYSIYISQVGSTVVQNLATCVAGPTQGTLQGQATQLAPGQTVVLTGIGVAKVPPAAPANGITVYPTWIFGKSAYCIVTLDDLQVNYLDTPEKTDPANQLKMASFKFFNGCFIKNNAFAMRIESTSQYQFAFG